MSGAEGLVIVGAIASVWTLIEACNKTKGLYTRLKDDRCTAYLSSLTPRLELMNETLELLKSHTTESSQTDNLRNHVSNVESLMGKFNQHISVLESTSGNNALQNLSRRRKASNAIEALKRLDDELLQWQSTMSVHIVTRLLPQPRTDAITNVARSNTIEPLICRTSGKKQVRKTPCQKGTCSCLCHLSWRKQRALIISAPTNLVMRCGCYKNDINISISALRRIWTLQVAVDWTQGTKMSSSIRWRNTVKRTSPGFLILEKCYHNQMTFESAWAALTILASERVISFTDVTPDGDGMLERVIDRPWDAPLYDLQWDLIIFLVQAGVPVDSERLLEISLTWVGEGPFIALIETLANHIHQPLDAADITPKLFSHWPRAADSNWRIPFQSGDTFYLRTLSALIESDPEFGGTTALHEAVLRNEKDRVEALSVRPDALKDDRNFLGQSVLHLAVLNSSMVALVLSKISGLDLDAQDKDGTTPLMYSMAYRQGESARLLLVAGADPFCCDSLNGFCAWDYALTCAGHTLLRSCMAAWSESRPDQLAQAIAYCLWHRLVMNVPRHYDPDFETLRFLLDEGVALDAVTPCDNTLLHLCDPREFEVLLDYDAIPINHKNCLGYTPLMAFVRSRCERLPDLMKRAISKGAVVDTVDGKRRNVLHHLTLSVFTEHYWGSIQSSTWHSAMKAAAVLLCANVDLSGGDSCQCLCSSHGCNSIGFFFPNKGSFGGRAVEAGDLDAIPWLLEWLIIIKRCRPTAEVHAALKALHRRCRFDEIGMTHTCCRRQQNKRNLGFERFSPLEDELEHHSKGNETCDGQEGLVHTAPEQDISAEEIREIRDEEKYYERELEHDCEAFCSIADSDMEAAWINVLSRRAVMMEEILDSKKERRSDGKVFHQRPKPDRKRIFGEIITEKPLRYVNPRRDIIEEIPPSFLCNGWFKPDPDTKLEGCVEEYLAAFNEDTEYMGSLGLPGNELADKDWREKRSKLVKQLLEEAERVRRAPQEDRDWDISFKGA